MKSLQIKVEYLTGMTEPQIQIGPYDISDPISRAIVSSLTLEAITLLENQQRVTISNQTQSTKTLTYNYN
jgi:predicted RNA methylase